MVRRSARIVQIQKRQELRKETQKKIEEEQQKEKDTLTSSHVVATSQNAREYMEDRYVACEPFHNSASFYGVYDGHGGFETAQYCIEKLPNIISKDKFFLKDPERALARSYKTIDKNWCKKF